MKYDLVHIYKEEKKLSGKKYECVVGGGRWGGDVTLQDGCMLYK